MFFLENMKITRFKAYLNKKVLPPSPFNEKECIESVAAAGFYF